MVNNVGRLIFDWLIPRSFPPISRNFLSNQKARGPKWMKVFISRLYLIYSRRNSTFPAEIASLLFELYYKGLYWHISELEHFFLDLIFTPKRIFLPASDNLLNFESKNSGWNKANLHFSNSPRGVVLFSTHGRQCR